jgi:hypothetical protein
VENKSLTIPSSAVEVPVLEDNGGEGVAERKDEAPEKDKVILKSHARYVCLLVCLGGRQIS